jgi:predicted amidohydrolase
MPPAVSQLDELPPPRKILAAVVQMTSTEDVGRNLEEAARLVRHAAAQGAALVGLPENFAFLGTDRDHRLTIAERLDPPGANGPGGAPGPILAAMTQLARESGVHLLLGGFPERSDTPTQIRNTSVLVAPDGRVIARAGSLVEATLIADIDLNENRSSHARALFLQHRRPELYAAWVGRA